MTSLTAPARPVRPRMAWITWRQHRMALTGAVILLGACALVLAITGLRMHADYARLTRAGCGLNGRPAPARCDGLWGAYYHAGYPLTGNIGLVSVGLSVVPLLIGMFVAAPTLAREYEAGTFRFAWTQAAGRTRWVVAKLALLGTGLTAAGGAFGALLSWWLGVVAPISDASRWQPSEFAGTAVTFAAWTLLAVAAGAFAGALLRRTVPAMAASGAFFAALFLVVYKRVDTWLVSAGPHIGRVTMLNMQAYQPGSPPPIFVSGQGAAEVVSAPPGSWPLRAWLSGPHGPHGHPPAGAALQRFLGLGPPAQDRWLTAHHVTLWAAYQPGGRFWLFQAAEGAALGLLALLLAAGTVWLVRHRAA